MSLYTKTTSVFPPPSVCMPVLSSLPSTHLSADVSAYLSVCLFSLYLPIHLPVFRASCMSVVSVCITIPTSTSQLPVAVFT